MIKSINVCYDADSNIKCGTSYNDWCETCPNKEFKKTLQYCTVQILVNKEGEYSIGWWRQ